MRNSFFFFFVVVQFAIIRDLALYRTRGHCIFTKVLKQKHYINFFLLENSLHGYLIAGTEHNAAV